MLRLKSLLIENAGAIENLNIQFPFTADNLPKPLILVGENGSGKTTALSFIADSLLQGVSTKFDDVLVPKGFGTLFYRLRSLDVRIGATSSITHICYEHRGQNLHYVDRIGDGADVAAIRQRLGLPPDLPLSAAEPIEKVWTPNIQQVAATVGEGAYVFFPSGRREIPHWMQETALHRERYSTKQRFGNSLNKSLIVETAAEETATWIMDGLVDMATGYPNAGIQIANQILQTILGNSAVHFAVAPRSVWPRVQIFTGLNGDAQNPRRPFIPSLAHLSAGQSMLLSMFGTIANHGTLGVNRHLQDVEGIVIIDEVEVYLHTQLQRTVLPRLIRLFPKVQFVITTHSPAFLMGMKDLFGSDGFEIRDMPSGAVIDVDQFSEIGAAVEALSQSTAFRDEVRAAIAQEHAQPILIVEGRSDAILIEGLWRMSTGAPPPFKIMTAKGRRALRYLLEDEQFIEEVGENQRVLGLFDFDEAFDDWKGCQRDYPHREGDDGAGLLRRHATKQIYAGLLPVPAMRAAQAGERFAAKSNFTIELYLPDETLTASQNVETETFPGDVEISKFRGEKVAFAQRVSVQADLLPHFEPLLDLIRRVLAV
ncbi:AAA family ATPase [Ralstonia mannitolilytica]|uniref:AAA family ATPase n=1 Tax=Ralstonia mannitolilytica TaxID=105219 RepID=UPI003B841D5C